MSKLSFIFAAVLSLTPLVNASAQQVPTPAPINAPSAAPPPSAAPNAASLDDRIQDAKADVIRLNRDLMVLEEELLFPANTQIAIFVSMDVGRMFSLDSVRVKLDDRTSRPISTRRPRCRRCTAVACSGCMWAT